MTCVTSETDARKYAHMARLQHGVICLSLPRTT